MMLPLCLTLLALSPTVVRAEEIKLNYVLSLYADEQGASLLHPASVACEGEGVTVADTGNGRLLRYVVRKGAIATTTEIRLPELGNPVLVRPGRDGSLFVLDGRQQRILRIGPDGAFKGYVEPAGVPGGSPVIIKSFTVDGNGSLYLLDVHGSRVLQLGPDGRFTREVRLPAEAGFASDITVTVTGTALVVDSVRAAIYAADRGATAFAPIVQSDRQALGFPTAIALDKEGMLYVLDRNAGSVVLLRPSGAVAGHRLSRGWKEGFLNYPSHLCITEQDDLFIADRNSSRVQLFSIIR